MASARWFICIQVQVKPEGALGLLKDLRQEGYTLSCCSYPKSDLVVELQDEDEVRHGLLTLLASPLAFLSNYRYCHLKSKDKGTVCHFHPGSKVHPMYMQQINPIVVCHTMLAVLTYLNLIQYRRGSPPFDCFQNSLMMVCDTAV